MKRVYVVIVRRCCIFNFHTGGMEKRYSRETTDESDIERKQKAKVGMHKYNDLKRVKLLCETLPVNPWAQMQVYSP